MSIMLTKQLLEKLRNCLADSSLEPNEFRRVTGLGDLYVSLSEQGEESFYFLYAVDIDGTTYNFFSKEEKK